MKRPARLALHPVLAAGTALMFGCTGGSLPVARQGIQAPTIADLREQPSLPLDPALLQAPTQEYRLGPGDKLEIEGMGDISTLTPVTVGPDGKIYYSILPGIDLWGLTLAEARERIADEMKKYFREKPVVSLALRSVGSQQVWLLGRVANPGIYSLGRPTSLLDALAQAGGPGVVTPAEGAPTETADLSRSFLVREGHIVPVDFERLLHDGDLTQNVYLKPDDFIFIPSLRSAQVHVLGAVVQPRSERMAGALTLVQAIALAGGTEPRACLPNVAILRGSLAHPNIAIVDVNQVLHGKAPDVRLEPGDIVYVPYTPERVLLRYVDLILDTFVRTVGVNEGSYAVSGKSTPISVGVNLTP